MARTSVGTLPLGSQFGMGLDRYAEILGLTLCGFNGVNKPTTNIDDRCHAIVTQSQRNSLAQFLLQAEQIREEELDYHLSPKWVIDESHDGCGNPFMLNRKYLMSVGVPASSDIELGAAVSYGTPPFDANNPPIDPVSIIVTTDVTTSEIAVTYPDEDVEITTKSVVDNGDGTVTISIYRCMLVKPEYNDDRDDPISYYDSDAFLETVDVRRKYVDTSQGASFVWLNDCGSAGCSTTCHPACAVIEGTDAYKLSVVHLRPATYANGSWTPVNCVSGVRGYPASAKISYLSGRYPMADEINTIRLAHTLMPREPCECDVVRDKWEEDNIITKHFTRYGSRHGAVEVWMMDQNNKIGSGGMFGEPLRHYW